jgi:hypothetical protein
VKCEAYFTGAAPCKRFQFVVLKRIGLCNSIKGYDNLFICATGRRVSTVLTRFLRLSLAFDLQPDLTGKGEFLEKKKSILGGPRSQPTGRDL